VAAWIGWLGDEEGLALPTVRKRVAALGTLVDLAVAFEVVDSTSSSMRPHTATFGLASSSSASRSSVDHASKALVS
jgi:paraquat-inducible protein B